MVGGAHERARFAVHEPHGPGRAAQLGKLVRVPVAHHRKLLCRGLQVLADVDDQHPRRAQIAQRRKHLGGSLAEPHHQAGLDQQVGGEPVRGLQEAHGPVVAGMRAHQRREAAHRFDIVRQHLRGGPHHGGDGIGGAAQVGAEQFHAATRYGADRRHRGSAYLGAAVAQVVAVHHGHHDVAQLHLGDRFGHPFRLGQVQLRRQAGVHGTEAAAPGAHAAQNHEGGGAVRAPALVNVGTARLFAHRGESLGTHQPAHRPEFLAHRRSRAQPGRLAQVGGVGRGIRGCRSRCRLGRNNVYRLYRVCRPWTRGRQQT